MLVKPSVFAGILFLLQLYEVNTADVPENHRYAHLYVQGSTKARYFTFLMENCLNTKKVH